MNEILAACITFISVDLEHTATINMAPFSTVHRARLFKPFNKLCNPKVNPFNANHETHFKHLGQRRPT
jgi:hypothetical protein